MRPRRERQALLVVAAVLGAAAVACGIGIRRDLSKIPAGQVGFDDMCGLQDYFDTLEVNAAAPPTLVSSVDLEFNAAKTIRGGKAQYGFETEFQLKHLRRVLGENWKRLPEELDTAKKVELEVYWSEKAGVKRVVTDADAELLINREAFPLPYHVCLSELLYGEPLYRQRRIMWGLPLPRRPPRSLLGDGGIPDALRAIPEAPVAPPAGPVDAGAASGTTGGKSPGATPEPRPDAGGPPPAFKPAPPAKTN
jgi:hypothetical protein